MDNDDALVGKIISRRQALWMVATAGVGLAIGDRLVRPALGAITGAITLPTTQPHLPLVVAPEMTEGPFFVDEKLNRSDLIAGSKRPSVANGLPLLLGITVYKLVGKTYAPLKNVTIDLWHADAAGHYSDENNPMNGEDTGGEKWLRGYQTTDDNGQVQFSTIFPGWYNGRAPHVHFKVRTPSTDGKATREFTSQFFFHNKDIDNVYGKQPYDAAQLRNGTRNEDDGVYTEQIADNSAAGSHMLLDLSPNSTGGHIANFPVILTDESLQSGRQHFGGPGGPGGGPGGPDRGPGGPPEMSLDDWLNGGPGFGPPPGPPPRR